MKIQLIVELEYDQPSMYDDDPDSRDWFFRDILGGDGLFLHSNEIGDTIGTVRVLEIAPTPSGKACHWCNGKGYRLEMPDTISKCRKCKGTGTASRAEVR